MNGRDLMNAESTESTAAHEGLIDRGAQVQIRRGAKALISTSKRVLLIKEQHADGSSFWTLPGGGVKDDESVFDGLGRELAEELHCQSIIDDAVTTFWYGHLSRQNTLSHYTVFACDLLSTPTPNRNEGVLEYRWVSPTDLPSPILPQVDHILRENATF